MTSPLEPGLEKRIADIEAALASMQASLDSLGRSLNDHPERAAAPARAPRMPGPHVDLSANAPLPPLAPHPRHAGQAQPVARPSARRAEPRRVDPSPPAWFAERSPEWWLGGLGIVFLIVALFLLYRYAVDHNWITPQVRVLTGVVVGAGLVAAGVRLTDSKETESDDVVGLREILLGGGIAVWYISSYAAAIYYQLISISSARVCFLALSVAAAWLALKERRLVFAVIAVGVGFVAPFILPSPAQAVIGLSLYLAALGAVGLVLYLMRGWQSVLWITFLGFWTGQVWREFDNPVFGAPSKGITAARVVITLVVVAFGVAFTRVPIMRRRLLALGSDLYAPSSTSDVPATWVITLATPLLTLGLLAWTWPQVATQFWGMATLAFGIEAFRLSRFANQPESKTAHIEATAAVLWTLAGSFWIVSSLVPRFVSDVGPLFLSVAALHAALAIRLVPRPDFIVARGMAKITGLISLATVVTYELTHV